MFSFGYIFSEKEERIAKEKEQGTYKEKVSKSWVCVCLAHAFVDMGFSPIPGSSETQQLWILGDHILSILTSVAPLVSPHALSVASP